MYWTYSIVYSKQTGRRDLLDSTERLDSNNLCKNVSSTDRWTYILAAVQVSCKGCRFHMLKRWRGDRLTCLMIAAKTAVPTKCFPLLSSLIFIRAQAWNVGGPTEPCSGINHVRNLLKCKGLLLGPEHKHARTLLELLQSLELEHIHLEFGQKSLKSVMSRFCEA